MPRAPDGTYTLPLPPVAPDDLIESTWGNTTLTDLANALTDSLSRSGDGGMNADFSVTDGTITLPGLNWTTEANSGLYRPSTGDVRMSIQGVDIMRWTAAGPAFWDGALWKLMIAEAPEDTKYYSRVDGNWAIDPAIQQNTDDIITNAEQITLNIEAIDALEAQSGGVWDYSSLTDGQFVGNSTTYTNAEIGSLAPGLALYLANPDNTVALGELASDRQATIIGISTGTLSIPNGGSVVTLLSGYMKKDSWSWTRGTALYLDTAGTMTQTIPTAGNLRVRVGMAVTSTVVYISPQDGHIVP